MIAPTKTRLHIAPAQEPPKSPDQIEREEKARWEKATRHLRRLYPAITFTPPVRARKS